MARWRRARWRGSHSRTARRLLWDAEKWDAGGRGLGDGKSSQNTCSGSGQAPSGGVAVLKIGMRGVALSVAEVRLTTSGGYKGVVYPHFVHNQVRDSEAPTLGVSRWSGSGHKLALVSGPYRTALGCAPSGSLAAGNSHTGHFVDRTALQGGEPIMSKTPKKHGTA